MDGAGGNPGSGGFDPCECINMFQMNHERAMTRLTDMLRNAQTTCTDTECFTNGLPGLQNPNANNTGMNSTFLMLAIWLAIALLLFFFRPRAARNTGDNLGKPANQGPRRDGPDPPEPQVQ